MKKSMLALIGIASQANAATVSFPSTESTQFGRQTIGIALSPGGIKAVEFELPNFVVSSTIELDVDNSTIRNHGSAIPITVGVNASGGGREFVGFTTPEPPTFPDLPLPPEPIYVDYTMEGSLTISFPANIFDTGTQDIMATSSGNFFDGTFIGKVTGVATMSYSLTTGGETFTGGSTFPIDYTLSNGTRMIDSSNYPISLSLSPASQIYFDSSDSDNRSSELGQVTASNGLSSGVYAIIPEPSSSSLILIAGGFLLRRKRKLKR